MFLTSWDGNYIDNITFLRTYRLLVNKYGMGANNDHFEPQVESMDVPLALWVVCLSCMVAIDQKSMLAGCYTMILLYIALQVGLFLLLQGGRFRMGNDIIGYSLFVPIITCYAALTTTLLMMSSSSAEIVPVMDAIMGVALMLGAAYMSWVSTATGCVTSNYASSVRRVLVR
jgi:hypothetical protein